MIRVQAQNDNNKWFVAVSGKRYILTDQDAIGHSHLCWRRDEGKWIGVTLNKDGTATFLHFGPIFPQDWVDCDFWGTWYGIDVWYYHRQDSPDCGSIIGRHGPEDGEYGSTLVRTLLNQYTDPTHKIGDMTQTPPITLPWMDWVWKYGGDMQRAWTMALATQAIKLFGNNGSALRQPL